MKQMYLGWLTLSPLQKTAAPFVVLWNYTKLFIGGVIGFFIYGLALPSQIVDAWLDAPRDRFGKIYKDHKTGAAIKEIFYDQTPARQDAYFMLKRTHARGDVELNRHYRNILLESCAVDDLQPHQKDVFESCLLK